MVRRHGRMNVLARWNSHIIHTFLDSSDSFTETVLYKGSFLISSPAYTFYGRYLQRFIFSNLNACHLGQTKFLVESFGARLSAQEVLQSL